MLPKKYYAQENLGTPANEVTEERNTERKEWYDFQLLNLIVKYVKKAKAEGKL